MKLPRDVSGQQLARLLQRFEYRTSRQTGSHMRLVSTLRGEEHAVTIPAHRQLPAGTLSSILGEVAGYLGMEKAALIDALFG